MNFKKAIVLVCSFLLLLALAFPVSNLQSLTADQILSENGLSQSTRQFTPHRHVRVRTLLKRLDAGPKVQVHLADRSQPSRVLVWSNSNLKTMPVISGRYFDRDDFKGQVTFAVVTPNVTSKLLVTQNNRYVEDGSRYWSVIGVLKNNQQAQKTRYYLSTGIKQDNSRDWLNHYQLTIDGLNRNQINRLSSYLHASPQVPSFVSQFRHRHRAYRALQWVFGAVVCLLLMGNAALYAYFNREGARLSKIHGALLTNWLVNRSFRFGLLQACFAVIAYWLMSARVFFSAGKVYAWLLIAGCILEIVTYILAMRHFNRAERTN
ncbi:MAG: hypothetical protein LKF01_06565 [Lactobacillus sp.]|jgi:hypothetical protein|nr:hypothetical protein [Lactobacillus sp.]MCH4069133.1 hypothetical protein [Lactobacillus sp.]MCI1303880.1 hypothetical protein [Lactobacillus sp.]MCI1329611.1 hypothetical protein [Lactobacillus sp.]MCI1399211.1 hypothetical protein [Lactobacillus sp.]